jgi:hypothetical protein
MEPGGRALCVASSPVCKMSPLERPCRLDTVPPEMMKQLSELSLAKLMNGARGASSHYACGLSGVA